MDSLAILHDSLTDGFIAVLAAILVPLLTPSALLLYSTLFFVQCEYSWTLMLPFFAFSVYIQKAANQVLGIIMTSISGGSLGLMTLIYARGCNTPLWHTQDVALLLRQALKSSI